MICCPVGDLVHRPGRLGGQQQRLRLPLQRVVHQRSEQRARELLALMERHGKPWRFSLFSSANTIERTGVELMIRPGVDKVWVGVESGQEVYEKNEGIDIKATIATLRDHGISVIASGILFLEHHLTRFVSLEHEGGP